jgi:hypothetical protein
VAPLVGGVTEISGYRHGPAAGKVEKLKRGLGGWLVDVVDASIDYCERAVQNAFQYLDGRAARGGYPPPHRLEKQFLLTSKRNDGIH